jgi:hypothetical protein
MCTFSRTGVYFFGVSVTYQMEQVSTFLSFVFTPLLLGVQWLLNRLSFFIFISFMSRAKNWGQILVSSIKLVNFLIFIDKIFSSTNKFLPNFHHVILIGGKTKKIWRREREDNSAVEREK